MAVPTVPTDCVVCLLNLNINRLFHPVQGYCPHSKFFKSLKPKYELSKFRIFLDIVLSLTFLYPIYLFLIYTPIACHSQNSSCLLFVSDLIFISGNSIIVILYFLNIKLQLKEMSQWIYIFECWKKLGFFKKGLCSKTQFKNLKFRQNLVTFIISVATIFYIFLNIFYSYDKLPSSIWRRFVIISWHNIYSYGVFESIQKTIFIGNILDSLNHALQSSLNSKLKNAKLFFSPKILEAYNISLLAIYTNTKVLSKFLAPTTIIWTRTSITSLILNGYTTVMFFDIYTLFFVQLRTVITIIELCLFYYSAEINLQQKVSFSHTNYLMLVITPFRSFIVVIISCLIKVNLH